LLERLSNRFGERRAMTVFATTNGGISVAILAFIDYLTGAPFIFPSLGPTIFHVFSRPMGQVSTPRNAFYGHIIGGACGFTSLVVFGLLGVGSVLQAGMGTSRILAIVLSIALTSGLLVFLNVEHPPAASTTLMFSLGFMSSLKDFGILMLAVVAVLIQAVVINRRAGFPYPLWRLGPELIEEYNSESKRGLPRQRNQEGS
jgi:CBS-domain-containing membrane protein